jgi:mRNA interferase RelE/StbE
MRGNQTAEELFHQGSPHKLSRGSRRLLHSGGTPEKAKKEAVDQQGSSESSSGAKMIYAVRWLEAAQDDLLKLGKAEAIRIVKKVETHLIQDPVRIGKPLRRNLKGLFKYRIGNYRVIYQIQQNELMIIVARVGHRRDVYN